MYANAVEVLVEREHEIIDDMVARYNAGRNFVWPTVSPSLISAVWEHYTRTGRVVDDGRFERVVDGLRDCVVLLRICTVLAGHETYGPDVEYEEHTANGVDFDALYEWAAAAADTEPISDYGLRPLVEILCEALSTPSNRMGLKIKLVDQLLHVAHQRGDLSALLVTGGRKSVMDFPELDVEQQGVGLNSSSNEWRLECMAPERPRIPPL